MGMVFFNVCSIVLICAAQNCEQQDIPRVQNKGTGVSQEVINAYEARQFDGMPYRLLLPANFESTRKYPLILNLHGGAGVGDDNESNLRSWSATFVDADWRAKYPCIVVVPQSTGSWLVTGEAVPELTPALKKNIFRSMASADRRTKLSAGTYFQRIAHQSL